MLPEKVFRICIVSQTIRPDQVDIINEILLRFVLYGLELLCHGTQIHGMFDDFLNC